MTINFRDGAIVERLRNAATAGPGAPIAHDYLNPLLLAAADEIERLQAAHDNMMALAGKVLVGPTYAEITKGVRRENPAGDACGNG